MTNDWALNYVLYYGGVYKLYFCVGYFRHKTTELLFLFLLHVTKRKIKGDTGESEGSSSRCTFPPPQTEFRALGWTGLG